MSPGRSELELFRALGAEDDPRNLAEFRNRLGRCVHWVLRRMAKGHTVAGEADDIVADALLRLEQLRERGFSGGGARVQKLSVQGGRQRLRGGAQPHALGDVVGCSGDVAGW